MSQDSLKEIAVSEENRQIFRESSENLKSLNIETISSLKDITYIGITSVLLNIQAYFAGFI